MSVTPFKVPGMTPTQVRVEAIVKAAADAGMGGFALAILRTIATDQIAPLMDALRPFASFADKAEQFVEGRAEDGGLPIMPTKDFRLADFRRAREITG
jgi:hypothetical protein